MAEQAGQLVHILGESGNGVYEKVDSEKGIDVEIDIGADVERDLDMDLNVGVYAKTGKIDDTYSICALPHSTMHASNLPAHLHRTYISTAQPGLSACFAIQSGYCLSYCLQMQFAT